MENLPIAKKIILFDGVCNLFLFDGSDFFYFNGDFLNDLFLDNFLFFFSP